MDAENTDPKIEAIQDDSATQAFFRGISITRNYLIFLCVMIFALTFVDKLNLASVKDLDKETRELISMLLESSQWIVGTIFFMLVGSFIFKGKGGSKFFESIGNLIDRATGFYKAKAMSKAGVKPKEEKDNA